MVTSASKQSKLSLTQIQHRQLPSGLKVYAANSAQALLDCLVETVTREQTNVLEDVFVVTPTIQTCAWLKNEFIERNGVCAGIQFIPLTNFIDQLRARYALGTAQRDGMSSLGQDPWTKEALTWRILRSLTEPEIRKAPQFEALGKWLAFDFEDVPRYQLDQRQKEQEASFEHFVNNFGLDDAQKSLELAVSAVVSYALQDVPLGSRHIAVHNVSYEEVTNTSSRRVTKSGEGDITIRRQDVTSLISKFLCEKLQDPTLVRPLSFDEWLSSTSVYVCSIFTQLKQASAEDLKQGITPIIESCIINNIQKPGPGSGSTKETRNNLSEAWTKALDDLGLDSKILSVVTEHVSDALISFASAQATDEALEERVQNLVSLQYGPLAQPGMSADLLDLRKRRSRRLGWAKETAKLFIDYIKNIPEMLQAWEQGDDVIINNDGSAHPLADDFCWQAFLWRYLCTSNQETYYPNPIAWLERIKQDEAKPAISQAAPVYLYGISNLLSYDEKVLNAISSDSFSFFTLSANPVFSLDSWNSERVRLNSSLGITESARGGQPNLHIHKCVGTTRQVEILQDLVVSYLDKKHPQSESVCKPSDIAVLSTNIENDAPYFVNAFYSFEKGLNAHPSNKVSSWMSYRLKAGQSHTYDFLLDILKIARGEAHYEDVLSLLTNPYVLARMGLNSEDVPLIEELLQAAGVYCAWGNTFHHQSLSYKQFSTWLFSLKRMAISIAMGETSDFTANFAVLDDSMTTVFGLSSQLVGTISKLVEFIENLYLNLSQLIVSLQFEDTNCSGIQEEDEPKLSFYSPDMLDESQVRVWTCSRWAKYCLSLIKACCAPFRLHQDSSEYTRMLSWLTALSRSKQSSDIALTLDEFTELVEAKGGRAVRPNKLMPASVVICNIDELSYIPFKKLIIFGMSDANFPKHTKPSAHNLLLWEFDVQTKSLRRREDVLSLANSERTSKQMLLNMLDAADEINILFDAKDIKTAQKMDAPTTVDDICAHAQSTGVCISESTHQLAAYQKPVQAGTTKTFYSYQTDLIHQYEVVQAQTKPDLKLPTINLELAAQSQSIHVQDFLKTLVSPIGDFVRKQLGIYIDQERKSIDAMWLSPLSALSNTKLVSKLLYSVDPLDKPFSVKQPVNELYAQLAADAPANSFFLQQELDKKVELASEIGCFLETEELCKDFRDPHIDQPINIKINQTQLQGSVETLANGVLINIAAHSVGNKSPHYDKLFETLLSTLLLASSTNGRQQIGYRVARKDNNWKVMPQQVAFDWSRQKEFLNRYLARLVRLYHLAQLLPLPFDHNAAYNFALDIYSQAHSEDDEKREAPDLAAFKRDYEQADLSFAWGSPDVWDEIRRLPTTPELIAYLLASPEDTHDVKRFAPAINLSELSLFELLALIVWLPFVETNKELNVIRWSNDNE